MNKKRIALRMLSIAMAVSTATVFTGCGKTKTDETEMATIEGYDYVPSLSDEVPTVTKSENGIDDGIVYISSYEGLSIPDGSDTATDICLDIFSDLYGAASFIVSYGYDTSDEAVEEAFEKFLRLHFDLEEVNRAIKTGDVVDYTFTTGENKETGENTVDTCFADYYVNSIGEEEPDPSVEYILSDNSDVLVEAMIGKSAGDNFVITIEDEEYNITIDTVCAYKEQEVTDAWVASVSDYDSVEDYKAEFAKEYKDGVNKAKQDYDRDCIISALCDNTQLLVSESSMKEEFTESYNLIIYDYLSLVGMGFYDSIEECIIAETNCKDVYEFCDWAKAEAFKNVRETHAIDLIFNNQEMTTSEDEIREAMESNNVDDSMYFSSLESEYEEELKEQKVADFLLESANVVSADTNN